MLKRIVIVSDGVDNKTMGYTKEELYGLLKEHPYPIYTLGCADKSNSNSEALKNMSALSRLTQAEAWLLDDVGDSMAVVQGVAGSNDVIRVEITVPAELRDGADKGVKLTLQAGGEVLELPQWYLCPLEPQTGGARRRQRRRYPARRRMRRPGLRRGPVWRRKSWKQLKSAQEKAVYIGSRRMRRISHCSSLNSCDCESPHSKKERK